MSRLLFPATCFGDSWLLSAWGKRRRINTGLEVRNQTILSRSYWYGEEVLPHY